jgi:hypothetical protein
VEKPNLIFHDQYHGTHLGKTIACRAETRDKLKHLLG